MAMSMDNEPFKVGDTAGFKDGIEQRGKIVKIDGDILHIEWWDEHDHEDKIIKKTARRCWKESF